MLQTKKKGEWSVQQNYQLDVFFGMLFDVEISTHKTIFRL